MNHYYSNHNKHWNLLGQIQLEMPAIKEDIMLRVCSMGSYGKHSAIMIGSAGAVKTIWAYVHMGSWSVYGSISNPGAVWGISQLQAHE